jgi:5-methylcytosine-specific restriction enzyme A
MTGRATAEWHGASSDAHVPPRVRLRVFERYGGKCWLTGRKIMPGDLWDLDHVQALCNGGSHSESNLAPALRDAHRKKTAADVAEKSKVARIRAKHLGIKTRKSRPIPGSKASGWRKPFNAPPERRS